MFPPTVLGVFAIHARPYEMANLCVTSSQLSSEVDGHVGIAAARSLSSQEHWHGLISDPSVHPCLRRWLCMRGTPQLLRWALQTGNTQVEKILMTPTNKGGAGIDGLEAFFSANYTMDMAMVM